MDYALNIAIALQVIFGSLITGLSACYRKECKSCADYNSHRWLISTSIDRPITHDPWYAMLQVEHWRNTAFSNVLQAFLLQAAWTPSLQLISLRHAVQMNRNSPSPALKMLNDSSVNVKPSRWTTAMSLWESSITNYLSRGIIWGTLRKCEWVSVSGSHLRRDDNFTENGSRHHLYDHFVRYLLPIDITRGLFHSFDCGPRWTMLIRIRFRYIVWSTPSCTWTGIGSNGEL